MTSKGSVVTVRRFLRIQSFLSLGLLVLLAAPVASAYSVLTHEAIIDSVWDTSIKGLLVSRFPDATADDLMHAHAYAYGGSIIQDMGYCPFGSVFFSDLLHYVRSGDFIVNLINDSTDLNEYAFSLGALAHYAADNNGHPMGVNLVVPLLFPKLALRFGKHVTYADDALSHVRTEFAFDVLQVAQGHYAPDSYHGFIGFEVARPLLERAFQETYELKMSDVFKSINLAIGSYRWSVHSLIPSMTRVAWNLKKDEIVKDAPSTTRKKFLYNLSRASYHKNWGKEYERPGRGASIMAFLVRIIPLGPYKKLKFRTPTPGEEKMFEASFNATLDRYRELLAGQKAGKLILPNRNLDVGEPVVPGKYTLSDRAYARLLDKLNGRYMDMPVGLRADILAFYGDLSAPISTKSDAKGWEHVVKQLDELKAVSVATAQSVQ